MKPFSWLAHISLTSFGWDGIYLILLGIDLGAHLNSFSVQVISATDIQVPQLDDVLALGFRLIDISKS